MGSTLLSRPVFAAVVLLLVAAYLALKRRARAIDPGLVSQVVAALERPVERERLLDAISLAGSHRVAPAIPALARLLTHADRAIGAAAARALGEIGDERALPYLVESARLLEDELARTRRESAPRLSPGPPLARPRPSGPLPQLVWADPDRMRPIVGRYLSHRASPDEMTLALLVIAQNSMIEPIERYFALRNIEIVGPSGLAEDLAGLAQDPHVLVRYGAVAALESAPGPTTVMTLLGATADPEPAVRARALLSLATLDPATHLEAARRLATDPDPGVRRLAAGAESPGPRE